MRTRLVAETLDRDARHLPCCHGRVWRGCYRRHGPRPSRQSPPSLDARITPGFNPGAGHDNELGAGRQNETTRPIHLLGPLSALVLAMIAIALALPAGAAARLQRVTSPLGIEAWLIEDHANPIISLALGFRGGAALDPKGKEGLADMATSLLDEGAGDLDSERFQKRLADLAVDLSFEAGTDNVTGQLRTLAPRRDEAFDLLRLALSAPRFDAEPVERIRGQMQAALARRAADPDDIAARTWWRVVFPDHAYGRSLSGTAASLAALAAADLRGWVGRRLARDNLEIGVVGDVTAAELAPLLDRTFGPLPEKAVPDDVPEATPQAAGEVIVVGRDVPQSVVLLGGAGPKRDDPDFYAASIVNHVLGGGGFTSRLTRELREARGLAYSVSSYLNPLDHVGLVEAEVATQNARVGESIALIREEWRRLAEEGPTQAELDDAKTFLTGSFPLRFSSTGGAAHMLVSVQLEDLGFDYLDRRNALIDAVTLEDARRVARRLLDPARLTIVVVGAPVGVTATRPAPADGS